MKQKLIIALILNLLLLYFAGEVFTSTVLANEFVLWRFAASLFSVIAFSFFVFMILRTGKLFYKN
jgi:hypothetical protein